LIGQKEICLSALIREIHVFQLAKLKSGRGLAFDFFDSAYCFLRGEFYSSKNQYD
jgi:hypothetical protein